MKPELPPESEEALLKRAMNLAGKTLSEVANQYKIDVPNNLRREKGWIGLLLEHALGATAGSKPVPDFPELGIKIQNDPISLAPGEGIG